jgi:hypothetical protein
VLANGGGGAGAGGGDDGGVGASTGAAGGGRSTPEGAARQFKDKEDAHNNHSHSIIK